MRPILFAAGILAFAILSPLVGLAKDVVNTKLQLSCTVSGIYPDGVKAKPGAKEEIGIEISRLNFNADTPSKPPAWGSMSNIKIISNGKKFEASLLQSTKETVAFSFANEIDPKQTVSLTYEIWLDTLRVKRTVMTLFSTEGNSIQSSEGICVRHNG